MLVRLGPALAERDAQAVVTHDVLARRVLTHVADVDRLAAFLALHLERDHFGGIPSRTASALYSKPTSLPSDVVTGELSRSCSSMKWAISCSDT